MYTYTYATWLPVYAQCKNTSTKQLTIAVIKFNTIPCTDLYFKSLYSDIIIHIAMVASVTVLATLVVLSLCVC